MNRNQNSHFAVAPQAEINRSRFSRPSSLKTSFNAGEIVPIFVDEVLPGDTFSMDTACVVRMQSLITPVMDNMYLDTYYFFVPNRLTWCHWQELMGENTSSAWIPAVSYQAPQITAPSGGWSVGTIADYMGIPTGVTGFTVSALPFRAYALIMDQWFRNENTSDPLNIPVDDTTQTGSNGSTFVSDVVNGGKPYVAMKYHDYFTSCLPGPQKGSPVMVPLGDEAPVYGRYGLPLELVPTNTKSSTMGNTAYYPFYTHNLFDSTNNKYTMNVNALPNSQALTQHNPWDPSTQQLDVADAGFDAYNRSSYAFGLRPKGRPTLFSSDSTVYADLQSVSGISVNTLRLAFQVQKLFEKDARSGSRYIEILKGHFGVTSPDARLQRAEYLGGKRIPINVNQVVQTSETSSTPQGTTAAYSLTTSSHSDFTKSFVEHGFVIGVAVVRYDHTYQQGLQRFWSRKDRFDWYWPVLANIGEQPVLNKEIYLQGATADDQVFGYQEAWADYRYKPSIVTGEMRSSYATSLDSWHLGDDYSSLPYLSDSWIREDKSNVDRVLAVQSSVSNQFFGDFYFKLTCVRPMPLYSIPGLIDHH